MPPRFAYWTILIDNAPTAFRARDAQELLPTLNQLKRTNANVLLRWFSGGQLWDSPEAARDARRRPRVVEKRGADWRPGGQHRDPRARFNKKGDRKPRRDAKLHASGKPYGAKPRAGGKPYGAKPHGNAPRSGPRAPGAFGQRRPWQPKPWQKDRGAPHRKKRRDEPE